LAEVKPLFVAAKKGLVVLLVFLFVAPPVQLLVALLMTHVWVGGQDVLIEISELIRLGFLPRLLPSYIHYMPVCLMCGLWVAYNVAKGRDLTLYGTLLRMVLAGAFFELLFLVALFLAGGFLILPQFLTLSHLGVIVTQWVISGTVCFFVWLKLQ